MIQLISPEIASLMAESKVSTPTLYVFIRMSLVVYIILLIFYISIMCIVY